MGNQYKKGIRNVIVAVGIIILIGMIAGIYNSYLRTLPQDYTIGIIYDIGAPAKGGTRAYYKYFINNEKFENSVSNYGFEETAGLGGRFLVEYPEGHPGSGFMYLGKPVPDSIEAPTFGWDELPVFAK